MFRVRNPLSTSFRVRKSEWLFPELLAAYPWVGIRIIPINLGEVLHLRELGFESVICLEMRYSDPAVVWGKERSHLCLCQINSPLASQRCIVQINELSIKATCLSPLKNRGLEGERSGFCPVSHPLAVLPPGQGPALAAGRHTLPLWDHVYGTKEFVICSFPKYKRTRFPLMLMVLCHYFWRQREREELGERGTQKDLLCLKTTVFGEWGDDPPSPHREARLMD